MTISLLLATRNQSKVAELQAILGQCGLDNPVVGAHQVKGLPQVVETGLSFADNARLKAASAASFYASKGQPVVAIADDSGLSVDVMGGMPGIFSARWVGKHGDDQANLRLLLDQLADVPQQHWTARFVCATVACAADGRSWSAQADVVGHLVPHPQGSNGFGYDPIFVPQGHSRTMAQLNPWEKNALSHRGKALRQLVEQLFANRPDWDRQS